jgi:hypothetical protein
MTATATQSQAAARALTACNVCDTALERSILDGDVGGLIVPVAKPAALYCEKETCQSRPRTRTLRTALDEHIAPRVADPARERNAIDLDGIAAHRRMLSRMFTNVLDAPRRKSKTTAADVNQLSKLALGSFDLILVTQLLDRTLEIDRVFEVAHRLLVQNGVLLFHLDVQRLRPHSRPPQLMGTSDRIVVGSNWLIDTLVSNGFHAEMYHYTDAFSGYVCPWFLGRKVS